MRTQKYGIRTTPPFMPYEPFYRGWGWSSISWESRENVCPLQESPRQTKPKKGPKRKVHEFRPFLWILVFFLGKTSTIHIELLFRNAPVKSSWTDLSLVWLLGPLLTSVPPTADVIILEQHAKPDLKSLASESHFRKAGCYNRVSYFQKSSDRGQCAILVGHPQTRHEPRQSSYPAEVRKWNSSPFFSAKGVVKFGVKFSALRFPRFGCAAENFTKISRQKRCEKRKISRKFHSAGAQRWHEPQPDMKLRILVRPCHAMAENVAKLMARKRNSRTSMGSPEKCVWGTKSPVRMMLLIFPGESYGPGGRKNWKDALQPVPVRRSNFPVWCSTVFQTTNFNAPCVTDVNPTWHNMKTTTWSTLHPTWNLKRETMASRSFISLGSKISPHIKNTPDMKRRHL